MAINDYKIRDCSLQNKIHQITFEKKHTWLFEIFYVFPLKKIVFSCWIPKTNFILLWGTCISSTLNVCTCCGWPSKIHIPKFSTSDWHIYKIILRKLLLPCWKCNPLLLNWALAPTNYWSKMRRWDNAWTRPGHSWKFPSPHSPAVHRSRTSRNPVGSQQTTPTSRIFLLLFHCALFLYYIWDFFNFL